MQTVTFTSNQQADCPCYHPAGAGPSGWPAAPFGVNKGSDLGQRAGIEHLARLDPSPPGRSNPEPHLPAERGRAMAVAVDGDASPPRRQPPCARCAVEIHVTGRAIDLERGPGLYRRRVERVEVEVVAVVSVRPAD